MEQRPEGATPAWLVRKMLVMEPERVSEPEGVTVEVRDPRAARGWVWRGRGGDLSLQQKAA